MTLLTRIQEGRGKDRELDGEIMFSFFAVPTGENGYLWPDDNPSWSFAIRFPGKTREWFARVRKGPDQETIIVWRDGDPILMNSQRVPPLTASLDACLALAEKVGPGMPFALVKGRLKSTDPLYAATLSYGGDQLALAHGSHNELPRSFLAALMKAMENK